MVLTWLIHVVADMRSVWCGTQPGQIASQVGSVRRVLFDLNYTVVEQLEALDDELFVLCAAPLPSHSCFGAKCTGCGAVFTLCSAALPTRCCGAAGGAGR